MATTTIRDTEGRQWSLRITAAAMKRARELAGVDLAGLAENKFRGLFELASDLPRLIDVAYAIVQPDAERRGVSDRDFGEAFEVDQAEELAEAFVEAWAVFMNRQVRGPFLAMMKKARGEAEKAMSQAAAELSRRVESGEIFTTAPESSE